MEENAGFLDSQKTMIYIIETLESVNSADSGLPFEYKHIMLEDCISLLKEYYIQEFLGIAQLDGVVDLLGTDINKIGN